MTTTNAKKIQNFQENPCKSCILNFAVCIEDCSFCKHFAEACDYNKVTPQMVLPWKLE